MTGRRGLLGRRLSRPGRRTADVRMFPGWASSVLWAPGPVTYAELGLPHDLAADLERWDLRWSRAWQPAAATPRRRDLRELDQVGRQLAQRVAAALGREIVLELQLHRRLWPHPRYRGRGPALVPQAAAVIRAHQKAAADDRARLDAVVARARADGVTLEWRADRPGEGQVG